MLKGLKSVNLKIIQMYHFRLKWKRYTVCTNWWDPNFLGLGLPLFPVGLLLFARWESWTPVFKILVRALSIFENIFFSISLNICFRCSKACRDPGIFVRGGGVQVSLTKKALTLFFLVLSLLYRSQMVNFKEIYHFSIFQRGSNFFQNSSNCSFPIETHTTCVWTPGPPLDLHLKEPSYWDCYFKYPQHKFWLINKKINFELRIII